MREPPSATDESRTFTGSPSSDGTANVSARALREASVSGAIRVAGRLAHELNNLVIPLVGYPDLIRKALGPESAVRPLLDRIERAAVVIQEMNEELIALSSSDSGVVERFSLDEIVKGWLAGRSIPPRIRLALQSARDAWPVRGRRDRVERALTALLEDAVEAALPDGRIEIRIANVPIDAPEAARLDVPPERCVRLSVASDGPRIPRERLELIFEPFAPSRSRKRNLRFALVHAVAQEHGGFVEASIDERGGSAPPVQDTTTISIYLPADLEEPTERGE